MANFPPETSMWKGRPSFTVIRAACDRREGQSSLERRYPVALTEAYRHAASVNRRKIALFYVGKHPTRDLERADKREVLTGLED